MGKVNICTLVLFAIAIFIVLLVINYTYNATAKKGRAPNYKLTLDAGWSINRYVNQPPAIDIDDAIVVIHSPDYAFFNVGEFASPGLVEYSDFGAPGPLLKELKSSPGVGSVHNLQKNNSVKVHLEPGMNFIGVAANIDNSKHLFAGIDLGLEKADFLKREIIIPLVLYGINESEVVMVSDDQYHYWRTVDPIGYLRIEKI